MHRSKLSAVVIDCQTNDLTEATRFWSAALGRKVDASEKPATNRYVKFGNGSEELIVLAQKVSHASRVHLDIETDDIEEEVKRLEALGAKRIEKIETWWVMQAPTGHRFCVIRPQRDGKMPDDSPHWETSPLAPTRTPEPIHPGPHQLRSPHDPEPPIKVPNPPEEEVDDVLREVPKVASRDAPGG